MVLGRKSIFMINIMIFVNSFGLMMIYFIVFGNIAASIAQAGSPDASMFFVSKQFFILIISICILPLALKKEIKELKIASVLLFIAIFLFILIFVIQILSSGNFANKD